MNGIIQMSFLIERLNEKEMEGVLTAKKKEKISKELPVLRVRQKGYRGYLSCRLSQENVVV